jgi:PAN-like domain
VFRSAFAATATVYAACSPNNQISALNGGGIDNIFFPDGTTSTQIYTITNANECCNNCFANPDCVVATFTLEGGCLQELAATPGQCPAGSAIFSVEQSRLQSNDVGYKSAMAIVVRLIMHKRLLLSSLEADGD